eukprot:COSAG02_NODE_2815_length_7969_cov_63.173930_4_plen_230_part_00
MPSGSCCTVVSAGLGSVPRANISDDNKAHLLRMNTQPSTRTVPERGVRAALRHPHRVVFDADAPASTIGTRVFATVPNRASPPNPAEDSIPMRINRAVCIARARLWRIDMPGADSQLRQAALGDRVLPGAQSSHRRDSPLARRPVQPSPPLPPAQADPPRATTPPFVCVRRFPPPQRVRPPQPKSPRGAVKPNEPHTAGRNSWSWTVENQASSQPEQNGTVFQYRLRHN